MNRLWNAIENERKDCLFIYITHDTQFAANHRQAKKIWVKDYDGTKWNWEFVNESNLPEKLLLDILGNRKPVLFVEGTAESFDTKLYTKLFPNHYVIPCGGCSTVINRTKAMNETDQLHEISCFGIIDRDYRSDWELEALKDHKIYSINVAEVENLFIVPEVLEIVNIIMGHKDNTAVEKTKNYIINERFKNEICKQILGATTSEVKYRLSTIDLPNTTEEKAQDVLNNIHNQIDWLDIKENNNMIFTNALKSDNLTTVLKVYNSKSLLKAIGTYFGISNKEYANFVLRHLSSESREKLINAFNSYLPSDVLKEI